MATRIAQHQADELLRVPSIPTGLQNVVHDLDSLLRTCSRDNEAAWEASSRRLTTLDERLTLMDEQLVSFREEVRAISQAQAAQALAKGVDRMVQGRVDGLETRVATLAEQHTQAGDHTRKMEASIAEVLVKARQGAAEACLARQQADTTLKLHQDLDRRFQFLEARIEAVLQKEEERDAQLSAVQAKLVAHTDGFQGFDLELKNPHIMQAVSQEVPPKVEERNAFQDTLPAALPEAPGQTQEAEARVGEAMRAQDVPARDQQLPTDPSGVDRVENGASLQQFGPRAVQVVRGEVLTYEPPSASPNSPSGHHPVPIRIEVSSPGSQLVAVSGTQCQSDGAIGDGLDLEPQCWQDPSLASPVEKLHSFLDASGRSTTPTESGATMTPLTSQPSWGSPIRAAVHDSATNTVSSVVTAVASGWIFPAPASMQRTPSSLRAQERPRNSSLPPGATTNPQAALVTPLAQFRGDVPTAVAAIDLNQSGHTDFIIAGPDLNQDSIPDVLQKRREHLSMATTSRIVPLPASASQATQQVVGGASRKTLAPASPMVVRAVGEQCRSFP